MRRQDTKVYLLKSQTTHKEGFLGIHFHPRWFDVEILRVFAQRVKLVLSIPKFFKLPSEKQNSLGLVFMLIGIGAVNYDMYRTTWSKN